MDPYRDAYFVPRESGLPEAKLWLAKNGNRVHPAFSVLSRYDNQRAQLTPQKQQAIDVFQFHSDRFLEALKICQKSAKNDLKDLDLGRALSWDDVMAEYRNAYQKYESKAQGWKVVPFLNFIPEGQYKSLFAGLSLIFAAAGRMSNRRQLILETFEGIPNRIYDAEKCCELCPTDESLQHVVMELYIAILVAIMDMMEWLVETGGWKQIKALCQGPRYGRSLDEKIRDIEKQSASVQRCIERLARETIARTESNTEKSVHLATDIKADTNGIQSDTKKIKEDSAVSRTVIARVEATHAAFAEMIRKMHTNMETILQETSRNNEWNEKRELEVTRLRERFESLNMNLNEAQSHQKRGMILESLQLLDLLKVNHTKVAEDLTSMLRLSRTADLSYHNRGNLLSRSPKFQNWLTSTSPIFLLVDGNGNSAIERTSSMTIVSALLAESLSDEGVACIHHFCGQHRTRDDDLSGPSGLLRALLTQLFNLHTFRIGFTNNTEYHELQRFDTARLCALFSELIMDLPPGFVLVCIIDGVSLYETSDWAEDLRTILETLNSLTRDPKVYAVFKVLVTSAMASRQAIRYIPREDHLMLPLDAGDGANSPLTVRHLKMQARRSVGSRARDQSPESLQSIFPEAVDDDEGFVDGIFDDDE